MESWCSPLYNHFFPGLQVWDLTAKGFTNQQMLQSSYAIAGGSSAYDASACTYSLTCATLYFCA